MLRWITSLLGAIGIGSILVGLWLAWVPLAFIAAGLTLIVAALDLAGGS